jgi:hypothetical protein
MIKVAERNPKFHRTIMKELAHASGESPLTPTTPKVHKPEKRRSKLRTHHKTLTPTPIRNHQRHIGVATERLYKAAYVYHSGQLTLKILFRSWLNDDNRQS